MPDLVSHFDLDDIFQFLIDALTDNAAKGQGSVVTIRVSPHAKNNQGAGRQPAVVTNDDVLDAHEVLKTFDGDFRAIFGSRQTQPEA